MDIINTNEHMTTIKQLLNRISDVKLDDILKNAPLAALRERLLDEASTNPLGDQVLVSNTKQIITLINKLTPSVKA